MESTKEIKGILHCHSSYSYDAKLSLSELRELFVSKGLSFVCMTEHTDELTPEQARAFVAECDALSDTAFRFIPGFEVPYRRAHVLMIGCRDFHLSYAPSIAELRPWVSSSSFVVLAHPVRNHFDVDEDLLASIDALEVWNQQYEGKHVPRTRSLALFEALHKEKESLRATGGVDFHRSEHMGSPTVSMHLTELTELHIIEKLHAGAFVVHGKRVSFFGTLPNARELRKETSMRSHFSVATIVLGKRVNKIFASLGLSLPKILKQMIRRYV